MVWIIRWTGKDRACGFPVFNSRPDYAVQNASKRPNSGVLFTLNPMICQSVIGHGTKRASRTYVPENTTLYTTSEFEK